MTKPKKKKTSKKPSKRVLLSKASKIKLPRAPVVAVLGHVDHGKTTLLDNIRKTKVQAQETGGITQHIGAYQVQNQGQPITFIDTPGHAAFVKMRQRGAQITDLVVLVVSAKDGVQPQTKESIRHIKAAGVPLVVAINKTDLPGASPDTVKSQLVESDVLVEGYGGDVVAVETVATKGKGVPELLEMILLVSKLSGLASHPQGKLRAVVIESKRDKRRGPLTSVIVKSGTLSVKDQIQSGAVTGTVKAIYDATGKPLKKITPGQPAEILGFKDLPPVGELVTRVGEKVEIKTVKPKPQDKATPKPKKKVVDEPETETEKPEADEEEERPRIKAVIKADTKGTLEAIENSVAEEVEKVGAGVGEVTESDVLLAQATDSKIIAFRVTVKPAAKKLAELEQVTIKHYQAIFELLEDLEKQVLKILEPTIDEEVVGVALITAEFKIKKQRIAGCKVQKGKLEVGGTIHLVRKEKILKDATIRSLKQGKKDIEVAKKGEECGVTLKPALDFEVGDTLQYYRVVDQEKK